MHMSNTAQHASGLTRRTFIAGAAVVAGALALAGCGNTQGDSAADTAASDEPAETDASSGGASGEPTTGGTFRFYLTNPVGIEPFHAEENMGVEVMYNLFMPLCEYDYEKGEVVPAAAESWEVNDTADEFTFHLRKDGKFHNGDPVRAQDFKYSWERLCRADFKPAPSTLGYKAAQVAGADEMMAGEADELDIECPDDYTLVVHLKAPFADFPSAVCERALCPVPEGCTDTEEDFQAFRVAPIGNGPFMMDGEWVDGQYIRLKPFEDYWGDKPLIDEISFQIYTDDQTAWTEFQAGNLDFTIIPSGLFNEAKETYGESSDGYTVNPGEQALFGDEDSIYYLPCNNDDEFLGNKDVRIAISYAIDRQSICDTVLQGTRSPATNMITPGVPGYEDGAWAYALPTRDLEKAAEYFDKAGYPADENGDRGITLSLSYNSGASNEDIMQMVQANLQECGVTCELNMQEWAAYIDAIQSGDYQIGRMGWVIQVPYMDAILQPLFYTGSGDNNWAYSNTDFDAAIDAARQITDDAERIAAYQEANAIVAEDFPVIPMFYYRHTYVGSARVNNFYFTPATYGRMDKCWLSE